MTQKDLQKPITLETLGKFTEEVLLTSLASKEDIKKMASKEDLKNGLKDLEDRLTTRLVTKEYLDEKLYKLEEKIMGRVIRERNKFKNALILVIGILRKNQKPTNKEVEALGILEQELNLL